MKLIETIKNNVGNPFEIHDCSRDYLPELFFDLGFKTGAEIGVYKAEFTEKLCKAGLKVYAIDPWKIYKDFDNPRGQERLDFLYEHSKRVLSPYPNSKIIRKTSMEALNDFEDESLDFVYIDGNHDFKYVAEDIFEWTNKVKKGGIISGHDYNFINSKTKQKDETVAYVLKAYLETFNINNWYILNDKKEFPSWMFFKK